MTDNAKPRPPAMKKSATAVALREDMLLKTYLQTGDVLQAGRAVGYAGDDRAVRSTAWTALMRVMKKNTVQEVGEIRDLEIARLDALNESLWPIAMGDLSIVPQFYKQGKELLPVECHDEPDPDDPSHEHTSVDGGPQRCYVIPSMSKLEAIEKCLKLMKRRSDYLGLDFTHGLDERRTQAVEQNSRILGELVRHTLQRLQLSEEQLAMFEVIFNEQLQKVLEPAT